MLGKETASVEEMVNNAKDRQWCDAEAWRPEGILKMAYENGRLIALPQFLRTPGHKPAGHKHTMGCLWNATKLRPCLALVHENFDPRRPTHWVLATEIDGRSVFYTDCRREITEEKKVDDYKFYRGWGFIIITIRNPE